MHFFHIFERRYCHNENFNKTIKRCLINFPNSKTKIFQTYVFHKTFPRFFKKFEFLKLARKILAF